MKPRSVYVDVDDTLISYQESLRVPQLGAITRIRRLHADGETLYLWSSGGAEYAREVAAQLGLEGCFVAFLPKPDMYIDDRPVSDWVDCEHSLPTSSDDY